MKKEKFIIVLMLLLLSTIIQAQEHFKGIISYETVKNNSLKTKDENKVWKYIIKIYISDNHVRIDNIESYGTNEIFKYTSIKNLEDSSEISFNTNYNKAALFQTKEKRDSLKNSKNISNHKDALELIYTNKTKRFFGYKCKKVDYHKANGTQKKYAYYTTKFILPKLVNEYLSFDNIEGLVMQFSYYYLGDEENNNPDQSTYTIKEITKCDLDSNIFLIPEGYKLFDNREDYRNDYEIWKEKT